VNCYRRVGRILGGPFMMLAAVFACSDLPAQAQTGALKAAFETYRLERIGRCKEPELQPYFAKSACDPFEFTPAQLNDTSKVTDEQKVALKRNRDEYTEQKRKLIQAMRKYGGQEDNASAALWEQLDVSGDQNFLDLYSGRITWGEYNQRRNELAEEFRKKNHEIRKSK
jgi:hypothetical protein